MINNGLRGVSRLPERDETAESTRWAYYGEGLQPWDFIYVFGMGPDFCAGNVLKYVGRYRGKGGLDDLKKARWYLERLVELVERKSS